MAKQKRSLADRVNTPTSTETTAAAQEKALKKLQTNKKPAKKKVRVSVDFPIELYEQMKADTEANGQTHRGFIVSLVRQHYADR